MPYVASNFIGTYAPTSKTLRIMRDGKVAFSINVCNYQKAAVSSNTILISLEDSTKEYLVDFSTEQEAKSALALFKLAIDTLRPNCESTVTYQPPTADTPIPVTYLQYKTLQAASQLVTFQWYDVVDTTGLVVTAGSTMRLLATSTNDNHPSGYVLSLDKAKISIDTSTDLVLYYEETTKKLTLINSNPLQQTVNAASRNMLVKNLSRLTATNCTNIEVEGESIVAATSCNYLKVGNQSNITIASANNVQIDNIQQDLTGLGFNLSNVIINQTTSIGKIGDGIISAAKTLQAYFDTVDQQIVLNTDNNAFTVTLENKIPLANAEFFIKITGTGTGNEVTINNKNSTLLYKLTDAHKDYWVKFRYIKSTGFFEFVRVDYGEGLNGVSYFPSPVTDNQTIFVLPIPAIIPSKLQMFINGQKKNFGLDYTYTSGSQTVTYTNSDFTIASTDTIEFIIF
jgi:hypothetical protein